MFPPHSISPPPIVPVIPTTTSTTSTTTVYAVNPTTTSTTTAAFVANPTPTTPASLNHPTYSEMIYEAIGALKERDGSSRRAIAKYIEGAYKNLPPTHSALLTHHLKRLKSNGHLVMVKKSYKLPRSDNHLPEASAADAAAVPVPTSDAAGPKRSRGRPPKSKLTTTPAVEPISQSVVVGSGQADAGGSNVQLQPAAEVVKRAAGAGRRKKNGPVAAAAERGLKKVRGRPPKSAATGAKKNTGRPKKMTSTGLSTVVAQNGVKRKRGRPPKAQVQPQAQPIVVPYANDATTNYTTSNIGVPNTPRSRGRPSKIAALPIAVGGGKRRGRPPKVAGVSKPMKPKKSTGKPVGRPKKTTEVPVQQTSLTAAYGDLQRKLQFFQSKVKQAVDMLKPQFTSESNTSAVAVIQELEGLAAMDISVPFREGA
ncbi:hypothetical protein SLEP1_g17186 [Rubroshorea leprosula]|uniref:H15 domain-containing protein n=1 Tax=Rubroshorea leprosula TaxID=152421 RepID=A0AAV5IZ96_9ROSI|nr:hypothetical protein SLEP1_g17186 [Rubroshorea leprosula]